MTTVTLRPVSVIQNTQGYTSPISDITDNSDSTYDTMTIGAYYYQMQYGGFTLPGGAVVVSVQQRVRAFGFTTYSTPFYLVIQGAAQAGMTVSGTGSTPTNFSSPVLTGAYSQTDVNSSSLYVDQSAGAGNGGGTRLAEAYLDVIYALSPTTSSVTTSPSGTITTSRTPVVGWAFTQGNGGSGGQTYFQVRIFTAAQIATGGFNPGSSTPAYDSGVYNSASASHTPTSYLANSVSYTAYVQTWQTTNGISQASGFVGGSSFTIAIPVPIPTAVSPINTSTVSTSRPALGASVAAMATGSLMRREWLFATNAGFTTGLTTITEVVAILSPTPSGSYAFSALPARLAQGVWYVKCRALDQDGVYGGYSAANSFTVSHPPTTTSRSPSASGSIQYTTTPTLSWVFSDIDTDDFQTKYQVHLWKTSTPGTVLDSTLLTAASTSFQFLSGIDATWKDTELRWAIQVYDQDNITAGYSADTIFYLRDLPVVAVTAPAAAAVITTAAPLVTWTDTFTAGRTQSQFKVDLLLASVIMATSGWTSSAALSWQCPTNTVTVGPTWQVTVSVIDSVGLQGSSTNNFTATYAAPTTPSWTISNTNFPLQAQNVLDWSASTADSNFYAWNLYRRVTGTSPWTLIYTTTSVGIRTYNDYLAGSQVSYDYVVVQQTLSFGTYVESVYSFQTKVGVCAYYLLVCPSNPSLNMVLSNVKSDDFTNEIETQVILLIGRGRRLEKGSRYGYNGTLAAQLRGSATLTARQQRLALENLQISSYVIYLRNPFGDVYRADLSNVKITRVPGTGLNEYIDVEISYLEITA